jgi:hypothetical protein
MLASNPLVNAVAQAAKQKQQPKKPQQQQGPSVVTLPRLDSNQPG